MTIHYNDYRFHWHLTYMRTFFQDAEYLTKYMQKSGSIQCDYLYNNGVLSSINEHQGKFYIHIRYTHTQCNKKRIYTTRVFALEWIFVFLPYIAQKTRVEPSGIPFFFVQLSYLLARYSAAAAAEWRKCFAEFATRWQY